LRLPISISAIIASETSCFAVQTAFAASLAMIGAAFRQIHSSRIFSAAAATFTRLPLQMQGLHASFWMSALLPAGLLEPGTPSLQRKEKSILSSK
jgi:hypothetical protein